jgi:hypothetical protein
MLKLDSSVSALLIATFFFVLVVEALGMLDDEEGDERKEEELAEAGDTATASFDILVGVTEEVASSADSCSCRKI